MLEIAHIINPVRVDRSSDLRAAQPVTFESMRTAREFAAQQTKVTHFTAQFPEDRSVIPPDFTPTPDLERSVLDIESFRVARKLPLMKDILDRLYRETTAEYLIYTNVDIALQPYFYRSVSKLAEQGFDAFVINRRTIPDTYRRLGDMPCMYSEVGKKHPGWDCFVFKRDLYPEFNLGTACIGSGWIGRVMITNMACFSGKFDVFKEMHVTFHIGEEMVWKSRQFFEYLEHNKNECKKILVDFDEKYGPFNRETLPGRFFRLLE